MMKQQQQTPKTPKTRVENCYPTKIQTILNRLRYLKVIFILICYRYVREVTFKPASDLIKTKSIFIDKKLAAHLLGKMPRQNGYI